MTITHILTMLSVTDVQNQFFSAFGRILFILAGLGLIFQRKIEDKLAEDNYTEKKIKIRPFSFVKTSVLGGLLLVAVLYLGIHKSTAVFYFLTIALGYTWLKFATVYAIKLHYTRKYIFLRKWGKTVKIPMDNVHSMHWETAPNNFGYLLTIHYSRGKIISLSSADFIGLRKLKDTFDKENADKLSELESHQTVPINAKRLFPHRRKTGDGLREP